MSDRLKSRCAGLIEIRGVHEESGNLGTVQYMHRIVRDFMEIPRTWSFLLSATAGTDFKLHKSLLKSIILHHRLVPKRYIGPDLFATARQALKSAQEACKDEHDPNDDLVLLLNTLNTTLNAGYDEKGGFIQSNPPHWSGLVDLENPKQWPDSFISAAVQYGLLPYLEEQLHRRKEILLKKRGRPLLDTAICIQRHCTIPVPLSQKRELAFLLLKAGADPNQFFGEYTVWQRFLISSTAEVLSNEDLVILLEIQKELVTFGASFAGSVTSVDQQIRWCGMIHKLWHRLDPERTGKVMSSIQRNDIAAQQDTSPETPLNSPLSPPSPPLTPRSPTINEIVSVHPMIPLRNECDTKSDGGNPKLKKESSIARRIRDWRRRRQ
ncbi:uncharacterized protein PAC_18995 [Phialocephala subalpina]|uniref:DUF7791 domain-containing protein n=1 Tax=Phialocephala subalpina TaxID=576137 RepID=A0A1L7XVL2_9HELO|nr:uncharacterized protein PAC_18995 [Phialocephala subalpina]